jgi:hypothetical protein
MTNINSYISNKLSQLNSNLIHNIDAAFKKEAHSSSELVGIRKVKSRPGIRTFLFPSKKNSGLIALESSLELAHAINLERNSDIIEYRTQAIKLFISEKKYIIPDFLVKKINSIEVHEVKANINMLSNERRLRFELAEKELKKYSISLKIYDAKKLPKRKDSQILNMHYQRANFKSFTPEELNFGRILLKENKINNKKDLSLILEQNNYSPLLADYFIFYENFLGDK